MKIQILSIGKSNPSFVKEGVEVYSNKIKHFCDFKWVEYTPKKKTENVKLAKEIDADLLLKSIEPSDYVVLLDEKGKPHSQESRLAANLGIDNNFDAIETAYGMGYRWKSPS